MKTTDGLSLPLIGSARLSFTPVTARLLREDLQGKELLAHALKVAVPNDWPPALLSRAVRQEWLTQLQAEAATARAGWYAIDRTGGMLCGLGVFRSPPCNGEVEIGYTVVPSCERRGFATEIVAMLTSFAFASFEVVTVVAETLPELIGSQRVLLKNGFALATSTRTQGVLRFHKHRT